MKYFHYAFICNGKAPCADSVGCWYRYHNSDGTIKKDIPENVWDQIAEFDMCDHTADIRYAKNVNLDFEVTTADDGNVCYFER